MRKTMIVVLLVMACCVKASTTDQQVQRQCLESLARFMEYAQSIYTDAGVSARGDSIGYFKAKDAGKSNEDGVRTNADLAMVTAYVYEKGRTRDIHLPAGMSYPQLRNMAIRSLRFAMATHRANQMAKCTDGRYWGSEQGKWKKEQGKWKMEGGRWQWESSLWSLSVALAAEFIDQGWGLTTYDRQQLERMLAMEADFEVNRPVPTGYKDDTKAEENGWEANVLAAAMVFCEGHPNIPTWKEALVRFGLNCYTVEADAKNKTPMMGKTVGEWYAGANLYPDFTLQNHGFFHASYQNVVMQEQAESLVALALAAQPTPLDQQPALRDALTWHWNDVWQKVLAQLALCDGEMAMPNGNDWSMFLFDQLPAYAAMATIKGNADALMLEQRCLASLLARQATTCDGAYMLNPDIGARRLGVTAHRVMTTALMHELFGTDGMTATTWANFQRRHAAARTLPHQNIARSMSEQRFAAFSWSEGLKSCAVLVVPNKVENSKIFVPYRKGFGGNVMGQPSSLPDKPTLLADSTEWLAFARGKHPYCIWATPGNAVIAIGSPKTKDFGAMAVSMDPMTSERRTFYYNNGKKWTTDARKAASLHSQWVNIDNGVAVVLPQSKRFTLTAREQVNSVYTAQLIPESNVCVYLSNVNATQTDQVASHTTTWTKDGWHAVLTRDPDGQTYLLAFNDGTTKKRFKMPRKLKKMKTLKKWIIDYSI